MRIEPITSIEGRIIFSAGTGATWVIPHGRVELTPEVEAGREHRWPDGDGVPPVVLERDPDQVAGMAITGHADLTDDDPVLGFFIPDLFAEIEAVADDLSSWKPWRWWTARRRARVAAAALRRPDVAQILGR